MHTILIVDDEPIILSSFKAYFRDFYNILTAENSDTGHEILSVNEVSVVLSDFKMPAKDGVLFLSEVHLKYPLISKILITAYEELQIAVDAINIGNINGYINKPWDFESLQFTLAKCVELYVLKKDTELLNEKLWNNERLIALLETKII